MINPDEIVTYARSWIGEPWRHQGRGEFRGAGIDCAGLLVRICQEFDLPHADLKGYRRAPGKEFLKNINAHTLRATKINPPNGAIGIFTDQIMPCHTGVFAVGPSGVVTVIHAEAYPAGAVHEEIFSGGVVFYRRTYQVGTKKSDLIGTESRYSGGELMLP